MSTLKVEVTSIDEIQPHPNADRLEIAVLKGWNCVVQKSAFKAGDKCVYFPIDSILPPEVECVVFPPDSKVKLSRSRVKTIRLRGAISQGLVVDPETLGLQKHKINSDVTELLKVTKYEPPAMMGPRSNTKQASKKQSNPHFHKYTSIENFKNYNTLFEAGEDVVITEKIHGTNFRCGWVPFVADTLWKKIKKLFGRVPKFEFVYGSHNVQLQNQLFYNGFYDKNVYSEAVVKYNLREILKPGEVLYGEIYGSGVQKGYTYGCADGERKLCVFDVRENEAFLSHARLESFCLANNLPLVPILYKGPFDFGLAKKLSEGDSVLDPKQKVREGAVIRPSSECQSYMGRKILKLINDEYLLGDQTEFH